MVYYLICHILYLSFIFLNALFRYDSLRWTNIMLYSCLHSNSMHKYSHFTQRKVYTRLFLRNSSARKYDDIKEDNKRDGRYDTGNGELQRESTTGANVSLVSGRFHRHYHRRPCPRSESGGA